MTPGRADPGRRVRPVHRRRRADPALPHRSIGRARRDLDAAGWRSRVRRVAEVAVLRELTEETGYEGEVVGLADVTDRVVTDPRAAAGCTRSASSIASGSTGGELRDEVDGSTDTCAWFTPEEASRLNLGGLAQHALSLAEAGARADASATADEPAAPDDTGS